MRDPGWRNSNNAAASARNSSLRVLYLTSDKVGSDGASKLAAALALSKTAGIEALFLGSNNTGDLGCGKIARGLESHSSLEKLYLSYNDNLGAASLAAALPSNATLRVLSLFRNNIGDDGAAPNLAAALPSSSLKELLHLYKNKIGDDGASKLLAASFDNLEKIDLSFNPITAYARSKLREMAAEKRTLYI
ncbi:hypothetical protein CTAYLR_009574 [Chrysophaeum taylorii]|uniref:Uncharacterized protein n=1 Tax=Chrysophaeum taylorii TaxID=2483200 RepID=A0AAD7XNF5_9STRA|nr:hypothetical protein CTAYLR_009574 [Chrysophaeum taylorii]